MRVLHFVTGGFSGATQVAVDLCLAAQADAATQTLLVLRKKRQTPMARVEQLRQQGLDVRLVSAPHNWLIVNQLRKIALEWKPDILVAHGFSEHLWGRYAGLLAGVPHLVHVEHNARERYTKIRLAQARWLAQRTSAIVGVSEGVRQVLVGLGFPKEKCHAILNGIDINKFPESALLPWPQREPSIVMAARFARQKDHATLITALSLLKQQHGLTPPLYLAGLGKSAIRKKCEALAQQLGLQAQVHFLGQVTDVPALLMRTQICVLATHYEGFGLALAEGMAAGCACIGSDVVGVQEVIQPNQTGLLVPESDAQALAQALAFYLQQPAQAQLMAQAARNYALAHFSQQRMHAQYHALLQRLAQSTQLATV